MVAKQMLAFQLQKLVSVSPRRSMVTTSSSSLTSLAKREAVNLGIVRGAQESVSSFARIIGPLPGGLVWTFTVSNKWPLDYHTAFHLCGLMMLFAAALSLKITKFTDNNFEES